MKTLLVVDIDDTLLKANPDVVKIWKRVGDGEVGLTTSEFALDPESKTHPELFDIREFRMPGKAYQSITKGTPLVPNLVKIDKIVNDGADLCFLSARSCELSVKRAIRKFLMIRDVSGNLRPLGKEYKPHLSHAVNDVKKNYPGSTDAEKKGIILKDLCEKYDEVIFIDDDPKNIKYANCLGISNLTVLRAE